MPSLPPLSLFALILSLVGAVAGLREGDGVGEGVAAIVTGDKGVIGRQHGLSVGAAEVDGGEIVGDDVAEFVLSGDGHTHEAAGGGAGWRRFTGPRGT